MRARIAAALAAALTGCLLAVPAAGADDNGAGDPDASPLRADAALFGSPLALSFALGTQIDVSNTPGSQSEVSVAVDPNNSQNLVAASNDIGAPGVRVYTSGDGGVTWTSATAPPSRPALHLRGRPVRRDRGQRNAVPVVPRRQGDGRVDVPHLRHRAATNASTNWTAPVPLDSPAGGQSDDKDQLTVGDGRRTKEYAFVAWDHNDPNAGLQQVQVAAFDAVGQSHLRPWPSVTAAAPGPRPSTPCPW